ncbi:MAG TPA: glycosyltransferase [Caulobacteraceae bacterium]|jgi:glycosyltransferase involved in cell wall biosynthesis
MSPQISVVVPVFDEAGNVAALAREIAAAFEGRDYEMVFVDDASRDGTPAALLALREELPRLRVLSHGRNAGQSRAVSTGVHASRGEIIVTLDGDGQNDPADGPKLVDRLLAAGPGTALVGGRRAKRRDTWSKRVGSRVGNGVRKRLLKDDADDTGCGLKAFRREVFLRFPYFDHMHRYIPALTQREGFRAEYMDVNHRPRGAGVSKYSNLRRLWVSLGDLIGVMWLIRRGRLPGEVTEA